MWSAVIMRLISSALWRSKASSSAAAAALTAVMVSASPARACGNRERGRAGLSFARLHSTDVEVKFGTHRWLCRHRRRGDALAVSANRQQHDVKLGAARLEALKHVSPIASPKG